MTNTKDASIAESLGADAIGLIFYEKSKRFVSIETAKNICNSLSPFTMKVGVFVNEQKEVIENILSEVKLNAIQLHGNETPEFCNSFSIPVIKCFGVDDSFDFSIINNFENHTIMLDTKVNNNIGGSGQNFNWNIIPNKLKNKIILAGGISSENIKFIYDKINPFGIDIVSSLEKFPGIKDENKMKNFFKVINELRRK